MSNEKASVSLPVDQLKDMFVTVLQEARKPVITDDDIRRAESQKQERRENAKLQQNKRDNQSAFQKICRHMQDDNGRTAMVRVFLNDTQYVICQHCQVKFFAGTPEFSQFIQIKGAA